MYEKKKLRIKCCGHKKYTYNKKQNIFFCWPNDNLFTVIINVYVLSIFFEWIQKTHLHSTHIHMQANDNESVELNAQSNLSLFFFCAHDVPKHTLL